MKPIRMLALVLISLLGFATTRAAGFSLFSRVEGDIVVVTDMTEAGRKRQPASLDAPIYYRGQSLGCALGSVPGDRLPAEKTMLKFVAKVLEKQGYRPSPGPAHPPELFMVVQWGCIRPRDQKALWFLGYEKMNDIGAPVMPGMLGPEIYRRGMRSHEVETVLGMSDEDIYAVMITAFEFDTAKSDHPIALWQSRAGFPAIGKSMEQALPRMVAAAGPSIGRETKTAVLRDSGERFIGNTKFGDIEVLGFDAPSSSPKK